MCITYDLSRYNKVGSSTPLFYIAFQHRLQIPFSCYQVAYMGSKYQLSNLINIPQQNYDYNHYHYHHGPALSST